MHSLPFNRIAVVGVTCSGKSTLAKHLADRLGYDFIELDALHWEPNWLEAPDEVFRKRVRMATQAELWVSAGNYSEVRDLIWSQAELVIWLDYPFWLVFHQLIRRTIRRWWTREELWNGNREAFWGHFKLWSDESLIKWLFKTYWRRKREYPMLLSLPENQHLTLTRFQHPRQTAQWLEGL